MKFLTIHRIRDSVQFPGSCPEHCIIGIASAVVPLVEPSSSNAEESVLHMMFIHLTTDDQMARAAATPSKPVKR
jgi:hypothetical protein